MADVHKEVRKLNTRIAQVQSRQGSAGCWAELLRFARQVGSLIERHDYMYEDPAKQVRAVRFTLRRLPQNQTWRIVGNRSRKLESIRNPTRKPR
jgi:hypothetical protein